MYWVARYLPLLGPLKGPMEITSSREWINKKMLEKYRWLNRHCVINSTLKKNQLVLIEMHSVTYGSHLGYLHVAKIRFTCCKKVI